MKGTLRSFVIACLLTCWCFTFLWLVQANRYLVFLRVYFQNILLCSALLTGLMALATYTAPAPNRRHNQQSWFIAAALLLLPVFYMRTAQSSTLGSHALAHRTTAKDLRPVDYGRDKPLGARLGIPLPFLIGTLRPAWQQLRTATKQGPPQGGQYQKTSILRFKAEFPQYYGKRLETIGMVYKGNCPPRHFVLFQFHLVCCAADALPRAVLVRSVEQRTFENDTWLRIRGYGTQTTLDGRPVALIVAEACQPIARPANPYTY